MSFKSQWCDDVITPPTTAPPKVYTDSSSVVVTEGDNVDLICHGSGIPLPRWFWTIDILLDSPNKVSTSILRFISVKLSQQGRYSCIGTNVLVNPPYGKRPASDMTYIDLIVKRKWQHVCVMLLWCDCSSPTPPHFHHHRYINVARAM